MCNHPACATSWEGCDECQVDEESNGEEESSEEEISGEEIDKYDSDESSGDDACDPQINPHYLHENNIKVSVLPHKAIVDILQVITEQCIQSTVHPSTTLALRHTGRFIRNVMSLYPRDFDMTMACLQTLTQDNSSRLFDSDLCCDDFVRSCFAVYQRWKSAKQGLVLVVSFVVLRICYHPAFICNFKRGPEFVVSMMNIMRDTDVPVIMETCAMFFVRSCVYQESLSQEIAKIGGMRRALSFLQNKNNTESMNDICISMVRQLLMFGDKKHYKVAPHKIYNILLKEMTRILEQCEARCESLECDGLELCCSIGKTLIVISNLVLSDKGHCVPLLERVINLYPNLPTCSMNVFVSYLNSRGSDLTLVRPDVVLRVLAQCVSCDNTAHICARRMYNTDEKEWDSWTESWVCCTSARTILSCLHSVARVDSSDAITFMRFTRTVLEKMQVSTPQPEDLKMFLHLSDLTMLIRGLYIHAPCMQTVCVEYVRMGIALLKMHIYCDMLDCHKAISILLLLQEHTTQESTEDSEIRMLLEQIL